jgi:hypothetical protein
VKEFGVNERLLRAFFEDLAVSEERAESATREAVLSPEVPVWVENVHAVELLRGSVSTPEQVEALATFVREVVHGAVHSALVSIDGGAKSAEIGQLDLVDGGGVSLGEGLHEKYVDYLFDTDRMR